MNSSLRLFICELLGVVLAALVPVVLVAFLSIPYSLGGHPGEERSTDTPKSQHMT
jgi:hypothetical protein